MSNDSTRSVYWSRRRKLTMLSIIPRDKRNHSYACNREAELVTRDRSRTSGPSEPHGNKIALIMLRINVLFVPMVLNLYGLNAVLNPYQGTIDATKIVAS